MSFAKGAKATPKFFGPSSGSLVVFLVEIFPITSDDFDEVFSVWERSVRASHLFLEEKDIQFMIPIVKAKAIPNAEIFCIRSDSNKIAGFIGTSGDEVDLLFVAPEFFGQGIGTALMKHAITNLECTKVDVNEQNPKALRFYEKLGFKVVGRSMLDGQGNPFALLHLKL